MKDRSWIEERTWVKETILPTKRIVAITACLAALLMVIAVVVRSIQEGR